VSLPDFSVRRPVTVFMATLAVTIFGAIASRQLPIELLPDLSYPTLTIQTTYPDAAPLSVEQFVTRPMEESVGVIPGVREMRSVSRAGLSEVILEFEWNEQMDFVAIDVREKMGLAEIPRESERPRVLRFDPSLDPIMRLAFTGDRPLDELRQVAERWLKPRLEAVQGVASARVRGGLDPEIEVEADEDRLASLGLTLEDLSRALRAENVNRPGGTVKDWGSVYLVRTLHEFENLDQLRRTVVKDTPSGRVRVEDVATVRRGSRDREEVTRSQGVEMVEIALHREGSTNTIQVATAIREELTKVRDELKSDLSLVMLTDQSTYIAESVSQVLSAALFGGLLAILVLYFFLRDPLATVIIGVTIPVSIVATFLPMLKAGVTLNIMSLGGLALGVGMLVDNSIVVLEAIDRHRGMGGSRREAAARGGAEVSGAVTAATLTTVAVFVPIVFVRGIAGQLFYDLAVTVCLSLLASLVVSLTLIPMLSAIELRGWRKSVGAAAEGDEILPWTFRIGPLALLPLGSGRTVLSKIATILFFPLRLVLLLLLLVGSGLWWGISRMFQFVTWPLTKIMDGIGHAYPPVLSGALRLRWAVLPIAFGLFAISAGAVRLLGTDLVPDLSQGEFAFQLRMTEGTTLESNAEFVRRIEGRLLGDDGFEKIFSVVGSLPSTASGRQTTGENLAQINFVLPVGARAEDEAKAVERVRRVIALFPNVEAELVHPSVLSVQAPVVVKIFSDDLEALEIESAKVVEAVSLVDGIDDITTTSEPGNPEITVALDRERAAALGVDAEAVAASMRAQIRGDVVGQFREEEERLDIRLRSSENWRDRASEVEQLRFRLPNGTAIPVSAVANVELGVGPAAIYRSGGSRVAEVTAQVVSGDLGHTLGLVRERLSGLAMAPGVMVEIAGQDEEMKVSFDSLRLALVLAIFMVYVVMAMQFESLKYPFVILLSVPLGAVGVVGALWITGSSISVLALIGVVMLAGIVVNNAIVLVDAINRRIRSGEAVEPAIVAAGRERLRPILMTTATTVLALLPMALGLGAGDELRRPMAITVIGGLSVATLLTLVVIPCLYRTMTVVAVRDEGTDRLPAGSVGEAPS